ncbi:CU044_5270 family protein [Streptomyces avermitilis]
MHDSPELDQLRDWDAGAPPLDDETRHRVRVRLFAAMNDPAPVVRRRRPVARIALTGTVAAAVAATALVAVRDDDGGARRTATPPANSSPAMRNVSARTVLYGAAAFSREHQRTVAPRDDQFIYTKEIIKETERETGAKKTYIDETWRSVDDTKPSWIMEIGKGWWSVPYKKRPGDHVESVSMWPPQDWDTLKSLPTDPAKLILKLNFGGRPLHSIDEVEDQEWSQIHFSLVGLLMLVPVMPQDLRPAAYEALAMVPGVKAVPNQKDAAGRRGVAITFDDRFSHRSNAETGAGNSFIFDPDTYEFLGFRDTRTSHGRTYDQFSYLDSWAVTDKAKQRP